MSDLLKIAADPYLGFITSSDAWQLSSFQNDLARGSQHLEKTELVDTWSILVAFI